MCKVHLIGSEGGGQGKSTTCATAIAYHQVRDLDCAIFDGDRSKPDVYMCHKDIGCRRAIFSESERFESGPDAIFEAALEKPVLVNMAAASFNALDAWLTNADVLALAAECDVTFYLWFLTDGSATANKLLLRSLRHFQGAVPHVVVKNHGLTQNWQLFNEDEALSDLMSQTNTPIVDFPVFHGEKERQLVTARRLSLVQASQDEAFGIISRQRIKKFIRESGEAFAATGLFES